MVGAAIICRFLWRRRLVQRAARAPAPSTAGSVRRWHLAEQVSAIKAMQGEINSGSLAAAGRRKKGRACVGGVNIEASVM